MKKIFVIALLVLSAGIAFGIYMYNKPHQDIETISSDYELAAATLLEEFNTDETAANKKYLDKVVKVSGQVSKVVEDPESGVSILLETGNPMANVICELDFVNDQSFKDIAVGQNITLKGICTGMLMDVVLVRCVRV